MRGSVRDIAITVRNLALLTDPKEMQPEWERVKKQEQLFVRNREELARMIATGAGTAEQQAFSKITGAEAVAMPTFDKAGRLGLQNLQQETTTYLMTVTRPAQWALQDALNAMTKNARGAVEQSSNGSQRATLMWLRCRY